MQSALGSDGPDSAALTPPASPATPPAARRSLSADSLLTTVSKLMVGLMNFVAAVVVAREFGPAGRGSVAVGLTLVLILTQLGNVGLTAANPYFATRDPALVGSLVANTLAWSAIVGGLLGGGLLLFRALLPGAIAGISVELVTLSAAAVPFGLAAVLLQSVLLGQGRILAFNGIESITAVAAVLALVVAQQTLHPSPAGALSILVAQYPASALIYLIALGRSSRRLRLDRRLAARMVRFGFRVYLAAVLSFLVIRLDLMLVNAFLGSAQAGLYSVAAVIAQGLIVAPYAIGMNLMPRVARGSDATYTATVFRTVAVLYGGICLVMALLAWPVVHWVYGARFDASFPMVAWLLPGTYALGMLTILSLHFVGRGYPREANVIWAAGVVLNVVLNLILLPLFGTVMASITSTVTYVFMLVLHVRLFHQVDAPAPRLRPSLSETAVLVRSRLRTRQELS